MLIDPSMRELNIIQFNFRLVFFILALSSYNPLIYGIQCQQNDDFMYKNGSNAINSSFVNHVG